MANVKIEYGTSTTLTITHGSLTSTSARESTAVDNGTNKYEDALVYIAVAGPTTVSGDKALYIYAYGSEDGTNYDSNATGSDAAITLTQPVNLKRIGIIQMPSNSTTYKAVFSIAAAFGGVLPRKWGIVIENQAGGTLNGSAACTYTGIYHTVV